MSEPKPSEATLEKAPAPVPGLVIHLDQIRDKPKEFSGELPAEALELTRLDGARNIGPVAYELRVTIPGEEVLVQGRLELPLEFECVKCAQFFKSTQTVPAFVCSFSLSEVPEALDIGPQLREELLLTFPTFPQCSRDNPGRPPLERARQLRFGWRHPGVVRWPSRNAERQNRKSEFASVPTSGNIRVSTSATNVECRACRTACARPAGCITANRFCP